MAISWSGWFSTVGSQQWRIGIDVSHNGNDTAWYSVWLQAMYPVSDTVTVYHYTSSTDKNIGTTAEVPIIEGVQVGGLSRGSSYTFGAYLDRNTVYTNGRPYENPSVSVTFVIPPVTPSAPGVSSLSNITSNNIRVNGVVPYNGGAAIDLWSFQSATDADFTQNFRDTHHDGHILDINNLNRYTTYYFRIYARNAVGWSPASGIASAATLASAPAAYPAPTIGATTASSAVINFGVNPDSGGPAITQSQLQVATNNTFTSLVYDQVASSGVTVSGLQTATTYYARTRAYNATAGWGAWSQTTQFNTNAVAPSQVPAPSISVITQTSANVNWTAPSSGGSAITGYDVQRATNSAFSAGLVTTAVTTLSTAFTGLSPGTTYWVRVRAKNAVGAGAYSTSTSFATTSATPSIVFTTLLPSNRISGLGGAAVTFAGWTGSTTITVQTSPSSTFASGVVTHTLTFTGTGGTETKDVTNNTVYPNGTYYARAKIKNNTTLYESAYSSTASYVVSHTPTVATLYPKNSAYASYASSMKFGFRFSDTGLNDNITEYNIRLLRNSDDLLISNTTTPYVSTATDHEVSLPVAASYKNTLLKWQIRAKDEHGQWSSYSDYALFTPADTPSLTVVQPTNGSTVQSGDPTFQWAATFPSGGTQQSATVQVYEQSSGAHVWTGAAGPYSSIKPSSVVLQNGTTYYYKLTVVDTFGLSKEVTATFTVAYVAPPSLQYTVDASFESLYSDGYVKISWAASSPDSRLHSFGVYRRETPLGSWELIADIRDVGARVFEDWTAESNKTYQYSVTQRADRSGVVLESPVGYVFNGSTSAPDNSEFTVTLSHYWLIVENDKSLNMRIDSVKQDDFSEEYESATINVIGRGRHRDYGTRYGYTGTLTIQLRGEHARANRLKLQQLRLSQDRYILKSPFGDIIPIALGDPNVSRIANTGPMEMTDISIAYEEVF